MKLEVPFYKSKKDTDCGPLALKMALEYFGKKYSFEKLSKEEKQLDSGLVWTLGIARASKVLGFKTKIISKNNFSHEEADIKYYEKYSNDEGKIILKKLNDELKVLCVGMSEKDLKLNELLEFLTLDSIPIVLINWFELTGSEGYSGHFVPITGYDSEFVYVHNPGLANAMAHMPIKRELFVRAWESKGTDKDVVIISKK